MLSIKIIIILLKINLDELVLAKSIRNTDSLASLENSKSKIYLYILLKFSR